MIDWILDKNDEQLGFEFGPDGFLEVFAEGLDNPTENGDILWVKTRHRLDPHEVSRLIALLITALLKKETHDTP